MFNLLNKYRHFLLGFLVASYLFSVFQKPLLEVVHFVSHIPQIIFSEDKFHSYHSHDQQVHQHQMLSTIKNQSENNDTKSLPQNEQNNKKKIEFVESYFHVSQNTISFSKSEFQFILPLNSIFITVVVPPPQFFS